MFGQPLFSSLVLSVAFSLSLVACGDESKEDTGGELSTDLDGGSDGGTDAGSDAGSDADGACFWFRCRCAMVFEVVASQAIEVGAPSPAHSTWALNDVHPKNPVGQEQR